MQTTTGDGDYGKAIELVENARALFPDIRSFIEQEAQVYVKWAEHTKEHGGLDAAVPLYEKAIDAYKEAIAEADRADAPGDLERLHRTVGDLLFVLANESTPSSVRWLEESVHHFRQAIEHDGRMARSIVWRFYQAREWQHVVDLAKHALSLYGYDEQLDIYLHNVMVTHYNGDEYETAAELARYRRTLLPDDWGRIRNEAQIYDGWARYAEDNESLSVAIPLYEQAVQLAKEAIALHGYDGQLDIVLNNAQWAYYRADEYEVAAELVRYRRRLVPDDWELTREEAQVYRWWADYTMDHDGFSVAEPLYEQAVHTYREAIEQARMAGAQDNLARLHERVGYVLHRMADTPTPDSARRRKESLYHFRQAIEHDIDGSQPIATAYYNLGRAAFEESPASLETRELLQTFLMRNDGTHDNVVEYTEGLIEVIDEIREKVYGDPGVTRIATEHAVFLGYGMTQEQLQPYAEEFESRTIHIAERDLKLRVTRWPVIVNVIGSQEFWDESSHCGHERAGGCYRPASRQVYIAHWANSRMSPTLLAHEYVHWLAAEEGRVRWAPSWFNEGLAEIVEGRVKGASGVWGSAAVERDGETVLSDSVSPDVGLTTLVDDDLNYAYAHTAVFHLVESRGHDALLHFLQLTMDGHPFDVAFEAAFGVTPDAFAEEYAQLVLDLRRNR